MGEAIVQTPDTRVAFTGTRLSWAAIWAGFIVATVVQIILSTAGLALGFSIWNPMTNGIRGFGTGAWIWFICTAIISLFLGGLAVGRLAGELSRWNSFLHATVMWGLSAMLAVWMVSNGLSSVVGTTIGAGSMSSSGIVTGALGSNRALASSEALESGANATLRDSIQTLLKSLRLTPTRVRESAGEVASRVERYSAAAGWIAFGTLIVSLATAWWGAEIMGKKAWGTDIGGKGGWGADIAATKGLGADITGKKHL